jgi:hypothetical protein
MNNRDWENCFFGSADMRRRSAAWRCCTGVAIACLIASAGVFAQVSEPVAKGSSVAAGSESSAVTQTDADADISQFERLAADAQASALGTRIRDRSLIAMTDDQILSLMRAMKPDAFIDYARSEMVPNDAYDYQMFRQERISGKWPNLPDHMYVRYQDFPRRVYARWLPDGAHAGQEILYDETVDAGSILGHLGGKLKVISGKVAIDGAFAHTQSRHSVRDLGLQFITRTVEHDARSFHEEGLNGKPDHIEVLNLHGVRLLAWTWDAPSGPPAHYASRVRLLFDLKHTWPWGEAAWNERGELLEQIRFDDVVPRLWEEADFDRLNPDYGFR